MLFAHVPGPLREQLKMGTMVISVGSISFDQNLLPIRRKNDEYLEENLSRVVFVPLVGKHGHKVDLF